MDMVRELDKIFIVLLGICVLLFLLVTTLMVYFVVKYHASKGHKPVEIKGSVLLETIWTVVPTLIVIFMFYYGLVGFTAMRNVPDNAMSVWVTARMWSWSFQYENGKESNVLYVTAGKPVKLIMTSEDVIHSLYIPAFRIKEDTVPGKETYMWFVADEKGEYDIFCAEYCGLQHSTMLAKAVVLDKDEFDKWLLSSDIALSADGDGESGEADETVVLINKGRQLFVLKGCNSCHTLEGIQPSFAPSLKDVYNSKRTVESGGKEITKTADEQYLIQSIVEPASEVVKGYTNIMPPLQSKSEDELKAIIEFLKSYR